MSASGIYDRNDVVIKPDTSVIERTAYQRGFKDALALVYGKMVMGEWSVSDIFIAMVGANHAAQEIEKSFSQHIVEYVNTAKASS